MAQQLSAGTMDEEVRRELVEAVLLAHDFVDLKSKLLSMLQPVLVAADNEATSTEADKGRVATRSQALRDLGVKPGVASTKSANRDATPTAASSLPDTDTAAPSAIHPCGGSSLKGIDGKPGVKPTGASTIELKKGSSPNNAKPTGASVKSAATADRKTWLPSITQRSGANTAEKRPDSGSAKLKDASTDKIAKGPNTKQAAASVQALDAETPCSQGATEGNSNATKPETSGIDEDGFQTVSSNRKGRKLAGRPKPASGPMPKRPAPLVLEGASETDQANPIRLKHLIAGGAELVRTTTRTKAGTVLIFPRAEEDSAKLLALPLTEGLRLRETKTRAARAAGHPPTVVVIGVHPSMEDEELSEETDRKCTRIVSSQLNGARTWKVKMQCMSDADRQTLIKSGIAVGLQHYKCVDYKHSSPVTQCFKCQGFDHISTACDKQSVCRRCGGSHSSKDCTDTGAICCGNCGGPHSASDYSCPVYKRKIVAKDSTALSYASAVKKGGDMVECVRLACVLAKSLTLTLRDRMRVEICESDICKDVAETVSEMYRVHLRGEYVYDMAFTNKGAASNPRHG